MVHSIQRQYYAKNRSIQVTLFLLSISCIVPQALFLHYFSTGDKYLIPIVNVAMKSLYLFNKIIETIKMAESFSFFSSFMYHRKQ